MSDRSPIEQQLIEGELYWDACGNLEFSGIVRLIHRFTMDVLGYYRKLWPYGAVSGPQLKHVWPATWNGAVPSKNIIRQCESEADAKLWIEQRAADWLKENYAAQ